MNKLKPENEMSKPFSQLRDKMSPESQKRSEDIFHETCCDYYQEGLDKLNAPIILATVRAGHDTYDGKPFVYCPWCGKKTRKSSNK